MYVFFLGTLVRHKPVHHLTAPISALPNPKPLFELWRKGTSRYLSVEEKARIVGLRDAGAKGPRIVRELGLPKSTVYTVLQNHKIWGTVESPKQPGQPSKLSDRDKRFGCVLTSNRPATLADVTNMVATKVSDRTIRKAAHELVWTHVLLQRSLSSMLGTSLGG